MHFKPSTTGEKEASLFFITGNGQQPVVPVGVNGTGVTAPDGAVSRQRTPDCGRAADLRPTGFPERTLRSTTAGFATAARCRAPRARSSSLGDGDIGSRFACRVLASNAVGSRMVTSAESAPVPARELARSGARSSTAGLAERSTRRARSASGDVESAWATASRSLQTPRSPFAPGQRWRSRSTAAGWGVVAGSRCRPPRYPPWRTALTPWA